MGNSSTWVRANAARASRSIFAEHLCALGGLLNSEVELCRSVGFPNVRTDEPDVRVAGEFEDEFFSLLETRCRFHDQSVGEASPLGVD